MPQVEAADHTKLSFTDWGDGRPVVFTHAWGLSSDQWGYQMPCLLEAGWRCVAYDRRGHGRSERPGAGYDFDTLADDLATIIEHLDLHDVVLVGHSVGCREAIRYLTRHGHSRVSRLVLVAPTTPQLRRSETNPDGLDPALIEANLDAIAENVPKWCADFERMGPYFGTSTKDLGGLVDWTARSIVDTPVHILLELQRQNMTVDMSAELSAIAVPTLVVHGDADASAPIDLTGRRTARLIPGAGLIEYAGAGHGLYASEHGRLNADLLGFISH